MVEKLDGALKNYLKNTRRKRQKQGVKQFENYTEIETNAVKEMCGCAVC